MRITCTIEEFKGHRQHAPSIEDDFTFGRPMYHVQAPQTSTLEFEHGDIEVRDGEWKLFVYERLEYRPDWIDDKEAAARFMEEHEIPLGATPKVVEKKNELIKISGYTVYKWQWIVICAGKHTIEVEEDFIKDIGGGALKEAKG